MRDPGYHVVGVFSVDSSAVGKYVSFGGLLDGESQDVSRTKFCFLLSLYMTVLYCTVQ